MNRRYIIGAILFVLLFTACSHDEKTEGQKEPTLLSIYVYLPEHPIVTRADEGSVEALLEAESKIFKLQIWVFNHANGKLVSYYSPASTDDLATATDGVTYRLKVSEEFEAADINSKPNVDVYVLANAFPSSMGKYFDESSSRADLDAAMMTGSLFGTGLTTEVPSSEGLPMSGVLRGVVVSGLAPVYTLPTVKLIRTVSKLRFVFSRDVSEEDVFINKIQLNGEQIPSQEFVFLSNDQDKWHVGSAYETALSFLSTPLNMASNDNPMDYIWRDGLEPQEYETKMTEGVTANKLSQVGPFYLRESNKRLMGTIWYQATGGEEKTANFAMSDEGDFSRNHTWIVYAYYGGSRLEVSNVYVMDWEQVASQNRNVHNW